ncbi:MAG: hypothetical protein QMB62_12175 [Oscillospiraceae bacterium]
MNWSEIIAALINAVGVIVAAIIGIGLINQVIRRNFTARMYSYSDKGKDLRKIIRGATHDIYIVANCGNNLFRNYEEFFCCLIKKGININILILDEPGYLIMDNYTVKGVFNNIPDYEALLNALTSLRNMQSIGNENLHIRTFPSIFTASYIGVDLDIDPLSSKYRKSSVLQIMFYQYRVSAKDSPSFCITPKSNSTHFNRTVASIFDMWDDGIEQPNIQDNLTQLMNLDKGSKTKSLKS